MLPPFQDLFVFFDASTTPNTGLSHMRRVSLGIYIVNLQVQSSNLTYIRAVSQENHSVIYAETTTLALSAVIIQRLGLHDVDFLFDSLQLVDILHSVEPADFPDWRIDPLIRMLQDYTRDRNSRVLKIDKQFNCIADSLARLTFSSFHLQYLDYVPSCSYEHSDLQCPLIFQEF
jgi:hypothetical protein